MGGSQAPTQFLTLLAPTFHFRARFREQCTPLHTKLSVKLCQAAPQAQIEGRGIGIIDARPANLCGVDTCLHEAARLVLQFVPLCSRADKIDARLALAMRSPHADDVVRYILDQMPLPVEKKSRQRQFDRFLMFPANTRVLTETNYC